MRDMGLYSGDYLETWLDILDDLGITSFGQLKDEALGSALPYSLIFHTADITRGKLVRLPWDYPNYAMAPDEQHIVKGLPRARNSMDSVDFQRCDLRLPGGPSGTACKPVRSNWPTAVAATAPPGAATAFRCRRRRHLRELGLTPGLVAR